MNISDTLDPSNQHGRTSTSAAVFCVKLSLVYAGFYFGGINLNLSVRKMLLCIPM